MNEEKKGDEEGEESEEIPQLVPIVAPKVGTKKKVEDIPCFRCSSIVPLAYM
jgi:hypothetical protein